MPHPCIERLPRSLVLWVPPPLSINHIVASDLSIRDMVSYMITIRTESGCHVIKNVEKLLKEYPFGPGYCVLKSPVYYTRALIGQHPCLDQGIQTRKFPLTFEKLKHSSSGSCFLRFTQVSQRPACLDNIQTPESIWYFFKGYMK